MKVVSDTSCITTLLKAGRLELAETLFRALQVPTGVWAELAAYHKEIPAFVQQTDTGSPPLAAGLDELGQGEAEAIALALRISADLLLTDDQAAARAARQRGLKVVGTVGLILLAKQRGVIPSVRQTLDLLEERGGLYLSKAVRLEALRLAGEG